MCEVTYGSETVACPACREVLVEGPVVERGPVVVHRVPDVMSGAMLVGVLESSGITAMLRTTALPGYGDVVRRDWSTTAWGEIVVPRSAFDEARDIIADYLAALEHGGLVRDDDVEGEAPEGRVE